MTPSASGGFRRRSARAMYESHSGPNMTPMVDVVMVILIFFMASAAMLGPEWLLRSHLAKRGPASAAPANAEPLRVRIGLSPGPGGETVVMLERGSDGAVQTNLDQVPSLLGTVAKSAGADQVVVLIAPDARAPYEAIVRIHEICARLGITQVGMLDGDRSGSGGK